MRHQKRGRKFGRVRNQRKAFLQSLAVNLIMKNKIKTTLPRAKTLRGVAERMVTLAKRNPEPQAAYREIRKFLPPAAATRLIKEVAPRYKERSGGYTRVLKLPPRKRDAAKMAYIEFI